MKDKYPAVAAALRDLSEEAPAPDAILFQLFFTVAQVAERAVCSKKVTAQHLNRLSHHRDYSRSRIDGIYGYRYDKYFPVKMSSNS